MRKRLSGGKVRHASPPRERRNEGNTRTMRQDRLLLDEIFGLIEYHARIIANWRVRVSMGPDGMLLDQAERIVALIKSLPPGVAETTAGGHDCD